MVEIRSEDFEWAAIYRMGKMLQNPHPDFKTTQTYSNFSAILCWTVQRIRTSPISAGTNLDAQRTRPDDPNFPIFDAIQLEMHGKGIEEFFGALPNATGSLNTLHTLDNQGQNITALAFAISLRNAVAHGDGRNVKPVNRPGQLVGFEFVMKNPSGFSEWSCETQLNRTALAQIAGKMVEVFCGNFRAQRSITESELSSIGESDE